MEIGEPKRVREVEPLTVPVPETIPTPLPEPDTEPAPPARESARQAITS